MYSKKRFYKSLLLEHLSTQRQMAFVSGPRQVGKTTICRDIADKYLNWDNTDDRAVILSGPKTIAEKIGANELSTSKPIVLFDELHKFKKWKQFLKGFFDSYSPSIRTMVTGSSRMDIYRRGGDSLMGRYFLYRMHPFTVAEVLYQDLPDQDKIIRLPKKITDDEFSALWVHSGYPEPFIKRDIRFSRRWQSLRLQQLLREDIRDLTQIQQIDQLESLVQMLISQSGSQLVYNNLANRVQITVDTVKRWINTLCSLHFGFLIRPWFKNVNRSIRKEPKWFLRDWSAIEDNGKRGETFVACHLLKAVEGWTDLGFGNFGLNYLRDKNQREVDFLVTKDGQPYFIVEVKMSQEAISPSLVYYQNQLNVPFAFQVVIEKDYVDANCFEHRQSPLVVPARTFLSQLI